MKSVLFCIPLKENCLDQFKDFVKTTGENRREEWKAMLLRYDIHSVKIWYSKIKGADYVFVYHDVGEDFSTRIAGWETSQNEFDQWFNQQIMSSYDTSAIEDEAVSLFDMVF
jgi:hypothetical protein